MPESTTTASPDPRPNPLAVFSQPEIKDDIVTVERLLSQSRQLVLLGAGCSYVAGLPLTAALYKFITDNLVNAKTKSLLEAIHAEYASCKTANLEDYLSDIVDLKAMADRRALRDLAECSVSYANMKFTPSELDTALTSIKEQIRIAISQPDAPPTLAFHRKFVRAMQRLHAGKSGALRRTDYFVLNYDTLIEDALGQERIAFSDGLAGGSTGWWDPERFGDAKLAARVVKLHGSIDWCLFEDKHFPIRLRPTKIPVVGAENVMIWPTATKYRETQLDPFAQVLSLFRTALRPPETDDAVLLIAGYSFGDAHINLEIERALLEGGERLSVIAMCFEDTPPAPVLTWLKNGTIGKQIRAYSARQIWHGSDCRDVPLQMGWGDFKVLAALLGGER